MIYHNIFSELLCMTVVKNLFVSDERLRDFTIDVGSAFNETAMTFDAADFTTIARVHGVQPNGELSFNVEYVGPGRFLKIQIVVGIYNMLNICEVEIFEYSF